MKIEIEEKDLREMLNYLESLRQENAMRLSRAEADIRRRERMVDFAQRKMDALSEYLTAREVWISDVVVKIGAKADKYKGLPSYKRIKEAWDKFDAIQKEVASEANF